MSLIEPISKEADGSAEFGVEGTRAGSRTLAVFGYSLTARVLRAHADGSMPSGQLDEALGAASRSSERAAVDRLCAVGALVRSGSGGRFRGTTTALTKAGHDLLPIVNALERWLHLAPGSPLGLEDEAARGVVKVLTAGWDSAMVRTLAEGPLTLGELSAVIDGFSYPKLKRRLAKLRTTGLVEPAGDGPAPSCAATDWLRHAVAPIILASHWEQKHHPGAQPISPPEVETDFMLALPLVQLRGRLSGACTLVVLVEDGERSKPIPVGILAEVEQGRISSCRTGDNPNPLTWALGTRDGWFKALVHGDLEALRIGGARPRLARGVVRGIHDTFAA